MDRLTSFRYSCLFVGFLLGTAVGCTSPKHSEVADVIIVNGNVYTLSWGEPSRDGTPAPDAPYSESGWTSDAEAVAVRDGEILLVGTNADVEKYSGEGTRVIDVAGATVIPGLIESHVHFVELGQSLSRVDVRGLDNEAEIVAKIRERAAETPEGEWVEGYGWDEGAWATRYPDMDLLSKEVPAHPVYLKGLHGFAVWGNRVAFERAGITGDTPSPEGGEIRKDDKGKPTGVL